ncbi:hypothetical protein WA026_014137 [Henosepilachna vigintioctopunctata]|uniref:Uncharacterized protein n=1 Tax=Henosepilachna vigintioctopunctata TaxID=420089 RepID=A0AAW1TTP1_9CUCU
MTSDADQKLIIQLPPVRQGLQLHDIKIRVNILEKKNSELKQNLEFIERNLYKKNQVVFGLEKSCVEISLSYVCEELNRLLDVEVAGSDKLKGTGSAVFHDITTGQRKELQTIKKNLLKARADSSKTSFMRSNKLVFGQEEHTSGELDGDTEDQQYDSALPT